MQVQMMFRTIAKSTHGFLHAALVLGLTVGLTAHAADEEEAKLRDGEIKKKGDSFVAWDKETRLWLEPVVFWESFAARRDGLTFGWKVKYPPYEQAREHDTIMIQVDSGPCLMEFFHQRWRRANDVNRWDPAFNEFGGCADVFK